MSKYYNWRDGWALNYPHPIKKPVKPESVTRCKGCGAWKIIATACLTCGKEGTNEHNS